LVLLNLAGGDCVEDLRRVEGDEGFCKVLRRVELDGLRRKEKREQERRGLKEKRRTVPLIFGGIRGTLEAFHDQEQEKLRQPGKARVPDPNQYLQGFPQVNRDMPGFVQSHRPQMRAALDMDATLVETNKTEALHCYKGYNSGLRKPIILPVKKDSFNRKEHRGHRDLIILPEFAN